MNRRSCAIYCAVLNPNPPSSPRLRERVNEVFDLLPRVRLRDADEQAVLDAVADVQAADDAALQQPRKQLRGRPRAADGELLEEGGIEGEGVAGEGGDALRGVVRALD